MSGLFHGNLIKKMLQDSDKNKFKNFVSTKIDRNTCYDIVHTVSNWKNSDYDEILIDAISKGNITIEGDLLPELYCCENEYLIEKIIDSDCLSPELYSELFLQTCSDRSELYIAIQVFESKNIDLNYNNGECFLKMCRCPNDELTKKFFKKFFDDEYKIDYKNKFFIEGIIHIIQKEDLKKLNILTKKGVDLSFLNNIKINTNKNRNQIISILSDSGIEPINIINLFANKY
ncbi:repeat protein [Moumouvirus goulette]|uniref:Repeat protein n=1 Tax=Moumouvirus goulette TaxID=1247379 RepID=M1PGB0_9VIRU|nr:repeat protein [Moumouvirus goulette]AGF85018.1 repeat protein [Moumouvirus goulette]